MIILWQHCINPLEPLFILFFKTVWHVKKMLCALPFISNTILNLTAEQCWKSFVLQAASPLLPFQSWAIRDCHYGYWFACLHSFMKLLYSVQRKTPVVILRQTLEQPPLVESVCEHLTIILSIIRSILFLAVNLHV